MDEKPRNRRWFQFSLVAVLVFVAACATILGLYRLWKSDAAFEIIGDIDARDIQQIQSIVKEPIARIRRVNEQVVEVETLSDPPARHEIMSKEWSRMPR